MADEPEKPKVPRNLILYAEGYSDRVATARLLVKDNSMHPGVESMVLKGIDHFDSLYAVACESRDASAAMNAAQGIEWIIGLYSPGRQINLLSTQNL
jgi:hypothetical protein